LILGYNNSGGTYAIYNDISDHGNACKL
jgi:hypothetical protein